MVRVNRKTGVLTLAVLLCLFSFASAALAQKATLTGKVTDNEAGEALPGANVVVSNAEVQTGAATKSSGEFTVKNLPEGTYTVTVSYIGYEKNVIENVEVSAGETKNLDIVLAITGIEINPISITASKREEKSMEAPASISVLEAREISEQVVMSSAEMLKNVPGIDLSTTGVDRREIVLRGFNNAFSGAAYILTDYRQAAVPSLNVNLHSLMPNMSIDLERIEIVRGPGSALYGAGVDAGVIHYFTKDPFNYPGTTFSFGGGERSSIAGQFRHAGVAGKLGYKITGQYAKADDWELNANDPLDIEQLQADAQDSTGNPLNPRNYDYKKFNVNGLLQYRFNDKTSLTAAGGYAALDAVILSGIGTLQADNFGYSYGQLRLQAGRFFAQAYLNKNDAGDSFVYGTGQKVVDKSTLLNLQAQYDFEFSENQQLIVGVDYDRTTPDTEGTIYGRNEDKDLVSETGVFAQSSTRISPKLNLTLGARADYNNIQEAFQLSPRVAVVLKPTPSHSFRATYNRAFASPGQNQNFLDIVAGRLPDTDIFIRGRGSAFG
ncbi:MAG: TonB-dependent receptor, partial [Calditrichaeota bacterium]|nr:TonB-dependent receptor [Calditrichota bacterium]